MKVFKLIVKEFYVFLEIVFVVFLDFGMDGIFDFEIL